MSEVINSDGLEIVFDSSPSALMKSDFEQAEDIANAIIETTLDGDPYPAIEQLRMLNRIKNLAGLSLAKVMHHLFVNWNEYGITDTCVDVLTSYLGFHKSSVKRYIGIWDLFASDKIPEGWQEEMRRKPINDLTPIMGALNQGYNISDDVWGELVEAPNNSAIAKIINKKVKDKEEDSDALYYLLDKNSGIMYVQNRGERFVVGRLALSSKDEPARRAISRLVETMNMQLVEDE